MSILIRFPPSSMSTEQYEQVKRRVSEGGGFPPDGMEYHVCFGPEGDRRVSEIWASREQFESFSERLMPAIQEAGIELGGEPEILEVYSEVRGQRGRRHAVA
jgi:hypothetical protein